MQKTHFKGATSFLLQQEPSCVIDYMSKNTIREELGMDMKAKNAKKAKVLGKTDISPDDKDLQDDFMALESDDSEFERNKISPETFAKNVLQECNFLKKPPHHTRPL